MIRLFIDFEGNMELTYSYQCEEELAQELVKVLDNILQNIDKDSVSKENKTLLERRKNLLRKMSEVPLMKQEKADTEKNREFEYVWKKDGQGHDVPEYPTWYRKSIFE